MTNVIDPRRGPASHAHRVGNTAVLVGPCGRTFGRVKEACFRITSRASADDRLGPEGDVMSARIKMRIRRPRYADVAATLALVFAMGGTAYAVVTTVPRNSVNTAAIRFHAVTSSKIATAAVSGDKIGSGAVTHGKLAANAVTGGDVKNHSLTVADLAGTTLVGAIAFTLSPNSCGKLILTVPGAKVGQAAVFNWVGTGDPVPGLMIGPLKVVEPGHVFLSACNITGNQIVGTNVKVRVTTLD